MGDAAHTHTGLPNVGNSCFLNVVLQSLAATEPLRLAIQTEPSQVPGQQQRASPAVAAYHAQQLVLSADADADAEGQAQGPAPPPFQGPMPLTSVLLQLLGEMWNQPESTERSRPSGSHAAVHVADTKALLAALKKRFPDLVTGQQQDAHEALSLLLDACQLEENDVLKGRTTNTAPERRTSSTLSISASEPSAASSSPHQHPCESTVKSALTMPPSTETLPRGSVVPQEKAQPVPVNDHVSQPTRQGTFPYGLSPPGEMSPNASLSPTNPYAHMIPPPSAQTQRDDPTPNIVIPPTHTDTTTPDVSTPIPHADPNFAPSPSTMPNEPATPVPHTNVPRPPCPPESVTSTAISLEQTEPGRALVDQIFEGKLVSTIICQACGYVSQTYEPFYALSLSLPQPSTSGAPSTQNKKRMAFLRLSERWSHLSSARSRPGTPGLNSEDNQNDMPAAAGTSFSPSMAKAVQRTAASLSRPGSAAPEESQPGTQVRKLWTRSNAATPNGGTVPLGPADIGLGSRPVSAVPSRVASRATDVGGTLRPPSTGPTLEPGKEKRRLFSRTPKPEKTDEDDEPRGLFRRRTGLRKKKDVPAAVTPSIPPSPQKPSHAPVARHTDGLNFTSMTGGDELDDEDLVPPPPLGTQGVVHSSPLGPHATLGSTNGSPILSCTSPGPSGPSGHHSGKEGLLLPHPHREDTLTPDLVGKLEEAYAHQPHLNGHKGDPSYFSHSSLQTHKPQKEGHRDRLHRHLRRSWRPPSTANGETMTPTQSHHHEPPEVPAHLLYIAQLLSSNPRKAVDPAVLYSLRDAASNRRGKLSVADVAAACASAAQTGTSISLDTPSPQGLNDGASGPPPEGSALRAQEGTGLVAALNTFTQSELLEGEDAFLCKRCWRTQHGVRPRERPHVVQTDGSDSSPDEESDYEPGPGLGLSGLGSPSAVPSGLPSVPSGLPSTMGESNSRASMSVPTLHTRFSATSLGDSDTSAPMLRSRTGSGNDNGWISDASVSATGTTGTNGMNAGVPLPASDAPVNVLVSGPGAPSDYTQSGQNQASTSSKTKRRQAGRIRQPALKRYLVASAPPVLVVQLKRFAVSNAGLPMSGTGEKLEEYVSFPPVLDVAPWLAPARQSYDRAGRPKVQSTEHAPHLPEAQSTQYTLVAVVVHTGQLASGHYTAYVQGALPTGKYWVHVSDEHVRYASWDEVSKAKAYMLFYQRVDTQPCSPQQSTPASAPSESIEPSAPSASSSLEPH